MHGALPHQILLGSVVVLFICIAVPEALRRSEGSYARLTISHYLTGKYGYITDIGFLLFSLSCAYVSYSLYDCTGEIAALTLSVGMLLSMLSARFGTLVTTAARAERFHVVVSVSALVAAMVLMIAETHNSAMAVILAEYPIAIICSLVFKLPIATMEKLSVMVIALWLIAYSLAGLGY